MSPSSRPFLSLPGSRPSPWSLFLYFFFINALLSYASIPLVWKLWLGLFGWALPFAFLLNTSVRKGDTDPDFPSQKDSPAPPPWVLILVLSVGLFLRITHPLGFLPWPIPDEALNAYFALGLDQRWDWHPFFFYSQLPPLLIWMLALLYKATDSFLVAVRTLPILLSIAIMFLAYPTARAFFPRRLSFLFFAFVSLAFPLLFFGRLCHQGLLLVLVEFIAFICLGKTLHSGKKALPVWMFLCGTAVGVGFYTYFSWALVALLMSTLLGTSLLARKWSWSTAGWFFTGIILPTLPLVWTALSHGYGDYLGLLWPYKSGLNVIEQLRVTVTCLSAFLWGSEKGFFSYGPVWGGFLNPLLGALFLVGALRLWDQRKTAMARSILFGILLFLIPAVLSRTLNNMREIQVLPLMLLVGALGALELRRSAPRWALPVLLALIPVIDGIHLLRSSDVIRHRWAGPRSHEAEKAYLILEGMRAAKGPGLILTSFNNDTYTYDRSILIAAYHFNALRNPRLRPENAKWLSIMTNVHFEPFLAREFPDAEWTELSVGGSDPSGGSLLGIIPWTDGNKEKLGPWVQVDTWFSGALAAVMALPTEKSRREFLRLLEEKLPEFPKDRFLRSIYWEMVYFNHNWENLYGDRDKDRHFARSVEALQKAISEGYPVAYFWNELGTMLALQGDKAGARSAFRKAMAAPLDLTPARENLGTLEP